MRYRITDGLVWRSTPASIAGGAVSVFACAEVVFATVVVGWLWISVGNLLPLWISLIAAPFLLLRSDESVEWAVGRFGEWGRTDRIPSRFAKRMVLVALCTAITFAIVWWLARHWLPGHEGWALFWRAALLAMAAANLAIAVAVAGALALAFAGAVIISRAGAIAIALTGALTVALMVPGALAGALAGVVAKAGMGAVAVLSLPSLLAGFWLASLIIRLLSILRHPLRGLHALPGNWRRVMVGEDLFHLPELIPGAGERILDAFRLDALWSKKDVSPFAKIWKWFITPIIPALAWRYSLKATAVVYAPLIYVLAPGRLSDPARREDWLDTPPDALDWLALGFAALTLALLALASIAPERLLDLLGMMMTQDGPAHPAVWLYALDLARAFDTPWRVASALGAALAIVIFLMARARRRPRRTRLAKGQDVACYPIDGAYMKTVVALDRLRTAAVFVSIALALWYATEFFYRAGALDFLAPVLSRLYG